MQTASPWLVMVDVPPPGKKHGISVAARCASEDEAEGLAMLLQLERPDLVYGAYSREYATAHFPTSVRLTG